MYSSKSLIRLFCRCSFIFFIGLATLLCTYVNDARSKSDYKKDLKYAQAFSHVLEHAAESILPSVVQIKTLRDNSALTEKKAENSPDLIQSHPSGLGTGVIIDFSPSTKTAVVITPVQLLRMPV